MYLYIKNVKNIKYSIQRTTHREGSDLIYDVWCTQIINKQLIAHYNEKLGYN